MHLLKIDHNYPRCRFVHAVRFYLHLISISIKTIHFKNYFPKLSFSNSYCWRARSCAIFMESAWEVPPGLAHRLNWSLARTREPTSPLRSGHVLRVAPVSASDTRLCVVSFTCSFHDPRFIKIFANSFLME